MSFLTFLVINSSSYVITRPWDGLLLAEYCRKDKCGYIVGSVLGSTWSLLLGLPVQSCLHLAWNIIVNGRNSFRLMIDNSPLSIVYVPQLMIVIGRMMKLCWFPIIFTYVYGFGYWLYRFPVSLIALAFLCSMHNLADWLIYAADSSVH